MPRRAVIAITQGEPAGIGPEIALRAAWELRDTVCPVLLGDFAQFSRCAAALDARIQLLPMTTSAPPPMEATNVLHVLDCPLITPPVPGYPDPLNAGAVLHALDVAITGVMNRHFDAMVTAPVQKSTINAAGIAFTGHTEYLAEKTGTPHVVMMLSAPILLPAQSRTPTLRVATATTHLPLAAVPRAISTTSLLETLRILHTGLQARFGIAHPRILVSGLNPHAGESGYLGTEEIHVIAPTIRLAQNEGIRAEGPHPADTLFSVPRLLDTDCFLVMYHDQGLPVLKYAASGNGVNITLGLPFVRTSVDHGTALDIAMQGTGRASHRSMSEAIRAAADMVGQPRK
ncbi:MAG: 4-hydroxythreonine-4-phosphate dehydrogenase PdxA [Burkholderiaceae bacterium]|jgi:4-hydroxythreonine-4-phosphate dehydrogenase|nr:4-hydroxythreonine-4-phosphate dehydrogenase PdxA [Burkholderiaceae bacterium]